MSVFIVFYGDQLQWHFAFVGVSATGHWCNEQLCLLRTLTMLRLLKLHACMKPRWKIICKSKIGSLLRAKIKSNAHLTDSVQAGEMYLFIHPFLFSWLHLLLISCYLVILKLCPMFFVLMLIVMAKQKDKVRMEHSLLLCCCCFFWNRGLCSFSRPSHTHHFSFSWSGSVGSSVFLRNTGCVRQEWDPGPS